MYHNSNKCQIGRNYAGNLKIESEFIVDRPAIQNSQWLNYTLQLIPKQVLNMTEFNWKCEKRKIMGFFFSNLTNR